MAYAIGDRSLSTPGRLLRAALWGGSLLGFGLFALALLGAIRSDGGLAYDAQSYWLAGQHVLAGERLYAEVGIGDPGAYRYTPTFAYLMAPLAVLPELAFAWVLRLASVLALRYLMGSWLWVGWALLFPPVVIELLAVNLTLLLAALTRWALRDGQLPAGLSPLSATIKYGAALLLPYLWIRRPLLRSSLAKGAIGIALISGAHYLVDPGIWHDFVGSLQQQAASVNDAPYVGDQLLFILPSTTWDFALRLGIAASLTGLAIWRRWDWLVFVATLVAVPTLWIARLAPLVAVPRMWFEERHGWAPTTVSVNRIVDAPERVDPDRATEA